MNFLLIRCEISHTKSSFGRRIKKGFTKANFDLTVFDLSAFDCTHHCSIRLDNFAFPGSPVLVIREGPAKDQSVVWGWARATCCLSVCPRPLYSWQSWDMTNTRNVMCLFVQEQSLGVQLHDVLLFIQKSRLLISRLYNNNSNNKGDFYKRPSTTPGRSTGRFTVTLITRARARAHTHTYTHTHTHTHTLTDTRHTHAVNVLLFSSFSFFKPVTENNSLTDC